jgi:hypothetical protein
MVTLSDELLNEMHARLAQRPRSESLEEREASIRSVLYAMQTERIQHLRIALDAASTLDLSGPLEVSPLVVALLQLPGELALLRAALDHP